MPLIDRTVGRARGIGDVVITAFDPRYQVEGARRCEPVTTILPGTGWAFRPHSGPTRAGPASDAEITWLGRIGGGKVKRYVEPFPRVVRSDWRLGLGGPSHSPHKLRIDFLSQNCDRTPTRTMGIGSEDNVDEPPAICAGTLSTVRASSHISASMPQRGRSRSVPGLRRTTIPRSSPPHQRHSDGCHLIEP